MGADRGGRVARSAWNPVVGALIDCPALPLACTRWGLKDGEFRLPTALALVPGAGLVVREFGNARFQTFAWTEAAPGPPVVEEVPDQVCNV